MGDYTDHISGAPEGLSIVSHASNVRDSIRYSLKPSILWAYALLMTLSLSKSLNPSFGFRFDHWIYSLYQGLIESVFGSGVLTASIIAAAALLIAAALFTVRVLAEADLIGNIYFFERGKGAGSGFGMCFSAKKIRTFFLLNIAGEAMRYSIYTFPLIVFLLFRSFDTVALVFALLFFLWIFILFPLSILIGVLMKLAGRSILLLDRSLCESVREAISICRRHSSDSVYLWFSAFCADALVLFCSAIVFFVAHALFRVLIVDMDAYSMARFISGAVLTITGIIAVRVLMIIGEVFKAANWTLAYIQIEGGMSSVFFRTKTKNPQKPYH